MYGRERDHENIVESLLRDETKSENGFSAVPIVGVGRVGKKTLAQHVYYDIRMQDHFDLQVSTYVGGDFDALKVTKSILKSIATDQPVDDNDLNLLQGKLKKQFSGKKFLLFLDDLWNVNYDLWSYLCRPLVESCAPGSKDVITTRFTDVATMVATTSTYPLECLSDEDCLRILAEQSLGTTDFSNDTEPILGPSDRSSHRMDIEEDNNIEDHQAQERRNWTVDFERIFVITNFIFELPSAVFDQLSSVHKPQWLSMRSGVC